MEVLKTLIIGSGPAGYTAAIYAARADLKPVLYTGMEPGGQLTTTTEVDNFPGYPKGVDGPTMMVQLQQQAERFGTEVRVEMIEKVELAKTTSGIHKAFTAGGTEIQAHTHHGRLNRVYRRVGDAHEKPHHQQATDYSRAGRKHLTREPSGQTGGDDPDYPCAGQRQPGPEQFAEYPTRQLTQGVAPNKCGIDPAHLDFADAELGHHEFARHVDVLAHQVREEAE